MKKLSNKEKLIFEKYSAEDAKEEQIYVYTGLKETNSKRRQRAVDDLIHYTMSELDMQYRRKEGFDNKVGFLLAFISIVFSIFAQSDFVKGIYYFPWDFTQIKSVIYIVVFYEIIISFIISIFLCLNILYSKDIYRLSIKDRKNNYRSAIDDPDMFKVGILEIYTESFVQNNDILNDMSKKYNCCEISTAFFLFGIILSCFVR